MLPSQVRSYTNVITPATLQALQLNNFLYIELTATNMASFRSLNIKLLNGANMKQIRWWRIELLRCEVEGIEVAGNQGPSSGKRSGPSGGNSHQSLPRSEEVEYSPLRSAAPHFSPLADRSKHRDHSHSESPVLKKLDKDNNTCGTTKSKR